MKKIIFIYFLLFNVILSYASNINGVLNTKLFYDYIPMPHAGFLYLMDSNLNKFCAKDYAFKSYLISLFQNRRKTSPRITSYKIFSDFTKKYFIKKFYNLDLLYFINVYFLFSSDSSYFVKFWNINLAIGNKEEKKKKERTSIKRC